MATKKKKTISLKPSLYITVTLKDGFVVKILGKVMNKEKFIDYISKITTTIPEYPIDSIEFNSQEYVK